MAEEAIRRAGNRPVVSSFPFDRLLSPFRVIAGALLAALLALTCQWPIISTDTSLVVFNTITVTSMVGCGLLMLRELRFTPWCLGLIACGLLWCARWSGVWDVGPFPVLSGFFNLMVYAVGGQVLLISPDRRASSRLDRIVIAWFWIGAPLTQAALVATSKPEWMGFSANSWWFGVFAGRDAFSVVSKITVVLTVLGAIGFGIALSRRLTVMVGLDRVVTFPIYVGAIAAGGISSLATGRALVALPKFDGMYLALTLGLIALPIAFVGAEVLRRLEHATISRALHQAFTDSQCSIADVEAALADTLRDPTLRLFVWDEMGTTSLVRPSPHAAPNRLVHELRAPDGTSVGVIDVDIALEHHPSLVATACQASAVALQNLHLHQDLEKKLVELERSRRRLAETAIEERRRIERDLHDGVQQRLLGVTAQLGVLSREPNQPELIQGIATEVRETITDLRRLANGIHPPELRQFGLRSAIDVVAERLPLEVANNIPDARFASAIETTLYFVACEALANVVKHARATKVEVTTSVMHDEVLLEVCDDGIGGADFSIGSGLVGCDDRIKSVGGSFEVGSNDMAGTVIRARVPLCE